MKRTISAVTRGILGRKGTARLGRFLYHEACLSLGNDPRTNGEHLVQERVSDWARTASHPVVIMDVGANVGDWTRTLTTRLTAAAVGHIVHAFEPFPATYDLLQSNVQAWGIGETVRVHNVALSSAAAEHEFYALGAGAGRNSLYAFLDSPGAVRSTVPCKTLDEACDEAGIGDVLFLKVDTEGHDLEVLRGAKSLLAGGRICALQFEYNHRWIMARTYLKDAFDLLTPFGYRIGKETRYGVEYYAGWDPELETFHEDNFLAVREGDVGRFPSVRWWNA